MPTTYQSFYEVRVKGTLHGSQTINVWHFGLATNPATNEALIALLTQLAESVIFCVIQFWLAAASSDWTLEGVDAKRTFPVPSDPIELSAPAGAVGARGTINCSFETVVLRLKSGIGGKRNRGRRFMPPPGDSDIANSVLQGGSTGDFMAQFLLCMTEKFIGATSDEPTKLVIKSAKTLKEQPGNWQAATVDVVQMNIEQRLSSLRSRKLGIGG